MASHRSTFAKCRPGWTLIVLLIVVAIIALLMALYLPSMFQGYKSPTATDEEGDTVPVLEHVEGQLETIDPHNQQIEDLLPENGSTEDDNQP